jgi:hypothetical protein
MVVAIALALWLPSTNGSKQADLASALLSGVVVGVVLVFVGKSFNAASEQAQSNAALQTSSEPTPVRDSVAVLPDATTLPPNARVTNGSSGGGTSASSPVSRTFRVEYEEFARDPSRVNALQLKLRVYEGDQYFQFVTIPVPYPEVSKATTSIPGAPLSQVFWQVTRSIEPQLIDAVNTGQIPKSDPTTPFEVPVSSLESALRNALKDKSRPEAIPGQTLYTFNATPTTPKNAQPPSSNG